MNILPFRLTTLNPSTILYHGSGRLLPTGYPTNPAGNWFSLDKEQAILHIIDKFFPTEEDAYDATCEAYLYEYSLKHPVRLIELDGENFPTIAHYFLNRYLLPFTYEDTELAAALCKAGISGWIFVDDQYQVMLCQPQQDLILQSYFMLPQSPQVIEYCRNINRLMRAREGLERQYDKIMKRDPDSRKIGRIQDQISDIDRDIDYNLEGLRRILPEPEFARLDSFGQVQNEIYKYKRLLPDTPKLFAGWKAYYRYSPVPTINMENGGEEYME